MSVIPFMPKLHKSGKAEKSKESRRMQDIMEVLSYLKLYSGEVFVIYCDGSMLLDPEMMKLFAQDIMFLKEMDISVFIVHGGDEYVAEILKKFNITSKFVDNIRVTDKDSIEVVEMALTGSLNKKLVSAISEAGGKALGISGKDSNFIEAKRMRSSSVTPNSNVRNIVDLGYTGEPISVNPELILTLEDTDLVPIISPIASGENGETFFINPVTISGVIASSLSVCKYIVLTDCPGLADKDGKIISHMTQHQVKQWQYSTKPPKDIDHIVNTCGCVLENGVDSAHIIDGRVPHSLLLEIFSEAGIGTCISNNEED